MNGFPIAIALVALAQKHAAGAVLFDVPSVYRTIQSAVDAVPGNSVDRYKIQLAPGVYNEAVTIPAQKANITLMGTPSVANSAVIIQTNGGMNNVVLTILGTDVIVYNLTLNNTSITQPEGPVYGAALWVQGQRTEFNNVRLLGYQDTIFFLPDSTSYFTGCEVDGYVDFLCGGGTAFIELSTIRTIASGGYVSAPRTPSNVPYGLIFSNCTLTRGPGVANNLTYLMRPWGPYGNSDFINCKMDSHIRPILWSAWDPPDEPNTEFCRANQFGGMNLDGTPKFFSPAPWDGHMTADQAATVTVSNVLGPWAPPSDPLTDGPPPGDVAQQSLSNVSTRVNVLTGDSIAIGGFINSGTDSKTVIFRGMGPSLTAAGVPSALNDPELTLYGPGGAVIADNRGWRSDHESEIAATGLAPHDDREAAIVATVPPGSYTIGLKSQSGNTGIALVEIYDLTPTRSQIMNLSTRGQAGTGDKVMINGFIIGGTKDTKVIVRAIGPSLSKDGVPDVMADPTIELHDRNGTVVGFNDNWRSAQPLEIIASGLAPTDDSESAILTTLPPGSYTAIVAGVGHTTGNALVEVYKLP